PPLFQSVQGKPARTRKSGHAGTSAPWLARQSTHTHSSWFCCYRFCDNDHTVSGGRNGAHSRKPSCLPVAQQQKWSYAGLLTILGALFLKGFREAIGVSFLIVCFYLLCNCVVVAKSLTIVAAHPELISNWQSALTLKYGSIPIMIGLSFILFPKLA